MFDATVNGDTRPTGNCSRTTPTVPGVSIAGRPRDRVIMNWVAGASGALKRVLGFPLLAAALALPLLATQAGAQSGILKKGDAAVSGFSGTRTDTDVPADVHPLDRTFIDLDGAALKIFDLSNLGTAPRGQLADAPETFAVKARDTGQVFGIALDDSVSGKAPDLYVTATSMFGLQIVAKNDQGGWDRLLSGAPGAQWMPGQFGLGKGGTPGAIYKIDGASGAVSLFANVKHDGRDNAGPGLGNIAFDARSKQLFVSDLETGLIHRITMDGQERDIFDHGELGRKAQGLDQIAYDPSRRMNIESPGFNVEDSATWGYADERRRVFALAVSNGRLYYSVAEGPAVWSVSIDDEGDFGADPRIELDMAKTPAGTQITDITFDGAGMMYLAQRGTTAGSYDYTTYAAPAQAVVVRYRFDEKAGRWVETPQEYAVGLAGEHRNTLGGVALNYGYDKTGRIDYGKCRQTMWTTGEHLREGEDAVRVSTGGAKIVHGLQGVYKARVRPENEPPYESWFTDFDGRYEDAESYGLVGDLAIYAPCDSPAGSRPQGAPLVTPEIIGEEPPLDEPGLVIDKRCHAGAIGGKIRCTITVRNTGSSLPSEPVKIADVTKILAGPGAGGLVPVVAVATPFPAIACAATPTPDFWCTVPPELLPPGDVVGIDVWVDTHDLALAGNLGFRNCAVLKHPEGFGKACAEGGTDIVVEKIGPGTCMPGGTCKFGLRIANAGLMPYDGEVLLADAMFVGGAVAGAPVTSVNPPIACSAGDTNQLPFTCQTHLSLMPGEEHIHWVEVTMPAPGGYWAENCFGALDPALMPVGPLPPGFGAGGGNGNPSCVWIEVPAPKENLKITKTGTDDFSKCNKIGDDLICKYEIAITNENTAAFNGALKIEEKVAPGATLISSGPVWGCAGGPPVYTCDTGGVVAIPAGGTVTIPVTVSIKVPAVEALGCSVPNEVKIVEPAGGVAGNLNAADDSASATEWTWGISWVDPVTNVTHVVCDPTNLKVTKSAKGPCTKADGGYACTYAVTITNTGPDPYQGPLKLSETLSAAADNASFSAPFSCSGNGANYNCETPVVDLAKGESLTLDVTATVTDNGRTCRLYNTAKLTFPVAGSKGNGDGGDDSASATAQVPSQACSPRAELPDPPTFVPLPRCPDGRLRRPNGTCPCPQGTLWNADVRRCETPVPRCYDPERRKDDGSCCPRGTFYDDESGRCRRPQPICPDPERRRDDGSCCPYGTVVSDRSDRCVTIETVCPPDTYWNYVRRACIPVRPFCDRGERFDWRTRECRPVFEHCPWGTRYNRRTERCERVDISCPVGTHWSRSRQRCEDDVTGGTCPDGSPRIKNGDCRCPMNRSWNRRTDTCEAIVIDPGFPGGPGGKYCPPGHRWVRGKCLPLGTGEPPIPDCPKGQHRLGRICVPDRPGGPVTPDACPDGKHRVGTVCVPDRIPPKVPGTDIGNGCPDGTHRVGRACLPDRVIVPPKVIPKPPVVTDPVPDCGKGQHRVGRACVPDRVIVPPKVVPKPPKIDPPRIEKPKYEPKMPPKVFPKPVPKYEPKVVPKYVPPKREVPQIKIKPQPKFDAPAGRAKQRYEPPQKQTPKFNKGGGGDGPVKQKGGNGGGFQLQIPKGLIKIN